MSAAGGMPRRQVLAIMGTVMVALFLSTLEQTVVGTALPRIAGDLGDVERMSWVVTAYMLAATITILLYGKLSDVYGRRPLFLVALGIFLVGSALAGGAQDMTQLIVFRGVQGAGAGGIWPLSMAIIGDVISPRERGRWQSAMGVVFAVAAVAGPAIGGAIADNTSWRWVFWLNVPLTIGALAVVARALHIPVERRRHRFDFAGAILLAVGVTALLLVLTWGGTTYSWGSPIMGALVAGTAGTFVLLVFQERRALEPIVPFSLFTNHTVVVSTVASFLIGAGLLSTVVFLPLFVQAVIGRSATSSGAIMMPFMFGVIVSGVLSGQLITRTGRYKVFPVTGAALMLAGFSLMATMGVGTGSGEVLRNAILLGLGMGLIAQVLTLATQNDIEHARLGVATSLLNFSRTIGAAVGVAGMGAVFVHRLSALAPTRAQDANALLNGETLSTLSPAVIASVRGALASALQTVFLIGVPIGAALLIATLLLRERPLRTTAHVGAVQDLQPVDPVVPPRSSGEAEWVRPEAESARPARATGKPCDLPIPDVARE